MVRFNPTIRLKAFLALGLLLIVAVSLGAFAMHRVGWVNGAANELRNKWLQSTQVVARIASLSTSTGLPKGRVVQQFDHSLAHRMAISQEMHGRMNS